MYSTLSIWTSLPNKPINIEIVHANNQKEIISVNHTYNLQQIEWFRAGSALNLIKETNKRP